MYNSNWARWIYSSVVVHFNNNRGTLPMFVEGDNRETQNVNKYFELRVDGPYSTEISRNYYKLEIEIGTVVCSIMQNIELYTQAELSGQVAKIFTPTIEVYKFGDGPDDDGSLLACLYLKQGRKEKLEIKHIGRVSPDTRLNRSIVEGHYFTKIT